MADVQRLQELMEENERLKKHIKWYVSTYEERSIPGIIKEKYKKKFKKTYIRLINSALKSNAIKKKYALAYALEFVKENGINFSLHETFEYLKKEGFKGLRVSKTILRKKAVEKLKQHFLYIPPKVAESDIPSITEDLKNIKFNPKISIIIPTYNTKPQHLRLTIESVRSQLYTNWELCIADDCSTNQATRDLLVEYQVDKRIQINFLKKNSGISIASNAAIQLASGDYLALLDHDDEITPDALYWFVKEINEHPDAEILYSDECKIDDNNILSDFFLKPDWSPELLINMMYVGHLTVYKRNFLVNKVGLFRKEYDFSQDYDLMLRAVEKTNNICHIKKVLYHWRLTEGSSSQGDKPYARISNLAALQNAAERRHIKGKVIELPTANRLKIEAGNGKKVSVIIPTDSYDNLKETLNSIIGITTYSNLEIVPVTNSKLIREMKELFYDERICYAIYDKPYNFSDKCNVGAQCATGDILIFYNDDVRPLQEDWVENTIEFLEIPGIGGVSPKLIYENDTIQYAGMATGVRNLTGTTFHCYPKDSTHYINFAQSVRNVSILSGACMAMPKKLFNELGGFDSVNTPSSHSDVDLSFKILDAGYRCVYTPYACLRHIGHLSLGEHEKIETKKKKDKSDIFLLKRWIKYLPEDRFFTEPMKSHLYHDSPEPFNLYAPLKIVTYGKKGDVLLVSHDLSLSGAPIMLFDTAKVLMQNGYYVIVVCPDDGPLRMVYQENGIAVIIDTLVLREHHSFERFAKNFDYIICNTVVTWPVVKQMQHIVKTVWWIQEGNVVNLFTHNQNFIETLAGAKNLVGVSDYSISFVKPYNKQIKKIYNACYDVKVERPDRYEHKKKVIFGLIGSIEPRKGQDVLINALESLSADMHNKIEVWFIGRTLDINYLESLMERIHKLGFVKILGEKNRAQCMSLMSEIDVVLNISRDDPFPVVLVEAMCLEKACIVSSNSGLAELIQNGDNGYVFPSEDAEALACQINLLIENANAIGRIGANARRTYEKFLTIDKFQQKLMTLMEEVE
jgi:O-antigen biosynthesis protein